MMNEPLSTIMSTNLITVSPEDSLSTAKAKLRSARIHHLPVVDSDMNLKGVISIRDFLKEGLDPGKFDSILVSEVMTSKLAVLEADEKIGAAAEVFLEHLFHAVPIVEGEKLIGIVTTFDILKYEFKKEYPNS